MDPSSNIGWNCEIVLPRRKDSQRQFMKLLMLVLLVASANASYAADANVVFSDDFESASPQSPPALWAMWGAQEFKVPGNYTRDTREPHAGQACFRIYHPARTRGTWCPRPSGRFRQGRA